MFFDILYMWLNVHILTRIQPDMYSETSHTVRVSG
jgi:hypothetical protein